MTDTYSKISKALFEGWGFETHSWGEYATACNTADSRYIQAIPAKNNRVRLSMFDRTTPGPGHLPDGEVFYDTTNEAGLRVLVEDAACFLANGELP